MRSTIRWFKCKLKPPKNRGLEPATADRAVLVYAWNKLIIRDHLERDIKEIKEIIVLSPTACLIFKGRHGAKEGFTQDDIPG